MAASGLELQSPACEFNLVCFSLTCKTFCPQVCLGICFESASAVHAASTVVSPAQAFHSSLLQPFMQRMLCLVLSGCLVIVCLCAGVLPLDLLPREGRTGTC